MLTFYSLDGYKRLILFSPEDGDNLYEERDGEARTSKVNIADPDELKHPLAKRATPYEVIAGSGDVVFIPAYWFHQVESSCRHIAVNLWFDTHDNRGFMNEFSKTKKQGELNPRSVDLVTQLLHRRSACPIVR